MDSFDFTYQDKLGIHHKLKYLRPADVPTFHIFWSLTTKQELIVSTTDLIAYAAIQTNIPTGNGHR